MDQRTPNSDAVCLRPDCTRPASRRGLCRSCYNQAGRYVRDGRTTWTALEADGKVLPARRDKRTPVIRAWLLNEE